MRSLPKPDVDDIEILRSVAENHRLTASATIGQVEAETLDRYAHYLRRTGNPWHVFPDPRFRDARYAFGSVYEAPPKNMTFISDVRKVKGACPMCGGDHPATVDHYLPKAEYPEFAFFSPNLIPACFRCNSLRRNLVRGDIPDERPLHPYFDQISNGRLVNIKAIPPFEAPKFEIAPAVTNDALAWHLRNIVVPAGLGAHCEQRWSRLTRKPKLHLGRPANNREVIGSLRELAERAADIDEARNAWDSCFYEGVAASPGAPEYLLALLAQQAEGEAVVRV